LKFDADACTRAAGGRVVARDACSEMIDAARRPRAWAHRR
jgi:hypothetical protein